MKLILLQNLQATAWQYELIIDLLLKKQYFLQFLYK